MQLNKEITEYSAKISRTLGEKGNRLFLVDSDKAFAAAAAVNIAGESGALVIVNDADVADDYVRVFAEQGKEAKAIASYADFTDCLSRVGYSQSGKAREESYVAVAAEFGRVFPNLVIALESGDGALLHRKLADFSGSNGTFAGAKGQAPYCISDFLAICGYKFLIADNALNLFGFTKLPEDADAAAYSPHAYDCIDFMQSWYVSDIAHSHSRLKKLAQVADKCILLSDVVLYRNTVELYAALNILTDDVKLSEVEKQVKQYTTSFEDDVQQVYTDVSYCTGEESIIGLLLQKVKDVKMFVPDTLASMSEYLGRKLTYVSLKELFLRVIHSHAMRRFGGNVRNMDDILDTLKDDESMANCFKSLFFENELKSKFESAFTQSHICVMNDDDIDKLMSIFGEYGMYAPVGYDCDKVDTVRIMRDDSGYEAFIENHASFADSDSDDEESVTVDETEYSVIHEGSDLLYECAALVQMCTDANAPRKAKLPLLVVTDKSADRVSKIITELFPEAHCTADFAQVSSVDDKNNVIITDFARIEKSARPVNLQTVVFFGAPANPERLITLMNKTASHGDTRAVIITRYGNLSARLSVKWNGIIERKSDFPLPLGMGEIEIRNNKFCEYDDAIESIEKVYKALKSAAAGKALNAMALSESFQRLELDLLGAGSFRTVVAAKDFGYINKIAGSFTEIFKNSVSVGRRGESTVISCYNNVFDEDSRILFNVCARMLRRSCDAIELDCCDCPEYGLLRKNDFESFAAAVRKFFDDTEAYARQRDGERQADVDAGIISISGGEIADPTLLTEKAVSAAKKPITPVLTALEKAFKKVKSFFVANYEDVEKIRSAVTEVYSRALDRYYSKLIEMFDFVSDKVTVRYCVSSAQGEASQQ